MNTHEQFVSLETSRLLKQAGFDWQCNHRYSEGHSINDSEPIYISPRDNWNQDNGLYSAPTQAVAQRWLREVKGIVCEIHYHKKTDNYQPRGCKIGAEHKTHYGVGSFPTYESALEAGLQKCLTLLIEKQ